jgi:2-keto-4-pentenoate hydratase/2-oxohepta-3-ene-1,7-dioic acid hydratase in catechol pathway
MRLYTFEAEGRRMIGAEQESRLVPLPWPDMIALIHAGAAGLAAARGVLAEAGPQAGYPIADVRLLAPVPRPGKIICSGVNYKAHGDEEPDVALPDTPGCFSKLPSAVTGPYDPIIHPRLSQEVDFEVELAVVLAKPLRHTPESQIMDAIFGYTVLHDVSARDIQFKEPKFNQITLGKNFDTFAPMGPCIVTPDQVPDVNNLRLKTFLNGEQMQDASTAEWIFPLPVMLSFFSRVFTLEPGDVVTTGSPAGIGAFRHPPIYMWPGDVVVVEVEGIGRLENRLVAEE